ncbi:MAG: gliding motility-associated C-terminal domain-containing protein, partial [Bacteroidales bacterium]|nr:gliding motility-associated C-terminal domain-containing protein [Bacteroidales bacterium]
LVGLYLIPNLSNAQTPIYKLDSTYHEQTRNTCEAILLDDGGSATNYSSNINYWTAYCPSTPNSRISMRFDQFDIHPSDTVKLFSGVGLNGTIHLTAGNVPYFTNNDLQGSTIMAHTTETSGCLTVQIITDGQNTASGFKANIECVSYCQHPIAALDTFFNKINPDGSRTPFLIRSFTDTVTKDSVTFDLIHYKAIDICYGDSIEIIAKPLFPDSAYGYPQTITNCEFYWDYGDKETDTILYNNYAYHKWDEVMGYNLELVIFDTLNGGCKSRNPIDVRVRIAKNPIKIVSPIPDMCSGELFTFSVGYAGNNSIGLDSISFVAEGKKRNADTVFIPDGPLCAAGTQCYVAPVTFDQFRANSNIVAATDIRSICINMEHAYLGDLDMSIICPNGQRALLKSYPGGGNTYLGIPHNGNNHSTSDFTNPCTAPPNPFGIGFTYCFSEYYPSVGQLGAGSPTITATFNEPTWGTTTGSVVSADSTDVNNHTGYYVAPDPFSSLIGCPLNGTWEIEICDHLGQDNGFVFWWELELSQNSGTGDAWEYQVPLDTVVMDGPFVIGNSDTSLVLAPPIDSCGIYNYDIHIVDDFLCVWDTVTKLEVVCTPQVNLGEDIQICEQLTTVLDAGNPGASEYLWEPTGEKTQTINITTPLNANDVLTYIAEVTNTNGMISCYGQDTIFIEVRPAGLAAFHTNPLILEGCEPFNFQLISNSTNADTIEWTVGQLKSSLPNPSFSFPYGTYDVKLKVKTQFGCVDSIIQPQMVHVYKSPTADFGWQPTNPSSTAPTVNFLNQTTPYDITNQYLWKIQAVKNSDLRENIFGMEPSYTWRPYPGLNVVGDYKVTLDAYTVNNGPSGILYECHDTITKVISIINDSLMFPNLISPNGDGINDVFIIRNLVDGQAFPDNELIIYNRNGKRIFYIQDIRSEVEAWDPNKTNTPAGTYFYKFIGRGPTKTVEFNGSIEIMR